VDLARGATLGPDIAPARKEKAGGGKPPPAGRMRNSVDQEWKCHSEPIALTWVSTALPFWTMAV
jgi:hypothetical protein